MKQVTIKLKNGKTENLSPVSFSRWVCLIEAFDIISQKAHELNIDIDKVLKPVAIEHYMNERYHSVFSDVNYELNNDLLS